MYQKYIASVFCYSGIRKLVYTYDTKYRQKIDDVIEEQPILYSHRVAQFLFAGIMGIGMAPIYICKDIERIEMYLRNIKPLPSVCISRSNDNYIDFYSVLWDHH